MRRLLAEAQTTSVQEGRSLAAVRQREQLGDDADSDLSLGGELLLEQA